MPFFDYECECGKVEEVMLSRSELDTKEILCPECQKPMQRLVSNPDFKFAGQPPRNYQPLKKNNPKSHIEPIRRKKQ